MFATNVGARIARPHEKIAWARIARPHENYKRGNRIEF
jgi:hypothetical protein